MRSSDWEEAGEAFDINYGRSGRMRRDGHSYLIDPIAARRTIDFSGVTGFTTGGSVHKAAP
jgi:hypothetical protein